MKQEYQITEGKYKGMRTTAATKEQAVKNLKRQLVYKLSKLTADEKKIIFVALDLMLDDYDGWHDSAPSFEAGQDIFSSIVRKLKL